MTEAAAKLSPWLSSCEAVARVAHHLGCTLEATEPRIVGKGKAGLIKARGAIETRPPVSLRIVGEGKGGRIKTCGAIETRLVLLPPAAWNGTVDLAGATMKSPEVAYEITNLELCYIDLVAAGLLPAPAEKARWLAAEAIAYLTKGVPLPWNEWMGAGATASEIEQAEIDLGQVIGEGAPAWGWHPLERRRKRIPSDDVRDERIENKAVPVSMAHRPKVVVDIAGCVTTSPRQRSADYTGPRWERVEVDAAALRQAHPRPVPPSPQVEPEPPPVKPTRRGPSARYDWDEGFQFMRRELDERGDPASPINAVEGWRSDADVARLVAAHIAIGDRQPDLKHTARTIRPKLKEWRAGQAERN